MKHTNNRLFLTLAALLCTSIPATAQQSGNQEQDDTEVNQKPIEKIQVRGVRSSIKESLFRKQKAIGVVDAIVAEDIGKFPDQNIAEALQRMTGIAITREAGEGKGVVVRGLGGDYNVTSINGRRMASEHSSRSFNYDVIASEMIGAAEVFKSPQSKTMEGGIGSVIDVQTRRPLDLAGFTLSGSVKGVYEERTNDTNPTLSFLVSDKFLNDSFGALLTAVYSQRTQRVDSYEGHGWYDETDDNAKNYLITKDVNRNGEFDKDIDQQYQSTLPAYIRYSNWQDTRERLGASFALQWLPRSNLDITLDGIYSRYQTNGKQFKISFVTFDEPWTPSIPALGDLQFNNEGKVESLELVNGAMAELLNVSAPRDTDTWQVGLNGKWIATENLTFDLDISGSQALAKNGGDNRFIVARGFVDSILINKTKGNRLPDVTMTPELSESQPFGAHYSYNYGNDIKDSIHEVRLTGEFLPHWDIIKNIEFGLHYGKQTKTRKSHESKNASQFSNGGAYFKDSDYASFDDSSVETIGGLKLFRLPGDVLVPVVFDNFLDGEAGKHPGGWPSFDYDKLYSFYESINAQAAEEQIKAHLQPKKSYELGEDTFAGFIQTNLNDEVWDLPYNLNLGVRVIRTEVSSDGYSLNLDSVKIEDVEEKEDDGSISMVPKFVDKEETYYDILSHEGSYTDILPSMNFKLNITDKVIYRFSAAKVITRPNISNLAPYSYVNLDQNKYNASNPSLEPLRAKQFDTTLEWYFSDYGHLSSALYIKDIQSFFIDGTIGTVDIDGRTFEYIGKKQDQYGASIKGVEIAYMQSFDEILPEPFDGLGIQLNYTYVDSSFDDPEKSHLPFNGMSKNSYNAVIYYEKDNYQARIAYNWRSKYLRHPTISKSKALWQADYGQLDFSASYNISDKFRADFSINNLTDEAHWGYVENESQVYSLARYGRMFTFGINGSF